MPHPNYHPRDSGAFHSGQDADHSRPFERPSKLVTRVAQDIQTSATSFQPMSPSTSLTPDSLESVKTPPSRPTNPSRSHGLRPDDWQYRDGKLPPTATKLESSSPMASPGPYFTGSANSEDYLIDIWTDIDQIDPFSYPADVQAYLECVSRWSRRLVNGICYYDHLKKSNGDGSLRSYSPDPQRILEGVAVLKSECAKGNTLYLPPGHQFSRQALEEFPHYPWMAGLDWKGRGAITELVGSAMGTSKADHLAFLIIGNVRIGLPSHLAGPEKNPYWVALIGAVYGDQHPSIIGSYPDRKELYTDAQINLHLEYDVSEIGGTKTEDPYEVDPIAPDDDDTARGATTPRSGWDGWVEI